GGRGRRPRVVGEGTGSAREHALEGRALFEAALPHQRSGAAFGHGDERRGPRRCRSAEPGRGEEKVQRGGSLTSSFFDFRRRVVLTRWQWIRSFGTHGLRVLLSGRH